MIDLNGEESVVIFIQYECDLDGRRSFRDRNLTLYKWKSVEVLQQEYAMMKSANPHAAEEQCLNILVNRSPSTVNRLSRISRPISWRCVLSEFMSLTENLKCLESILKDFPELDTLEFREHFQKLIGTLPKVPRKLEEVTGEQKRESEQEQPNISHTLFGDIVEL